MTAHLQGNGLDAVQPDSLSCLQDRGLLALTWQLLSLQARQEKKST
jgi:hypothetical protein